MSGVSVRGVTFETEKALKKIHTQKSHIQKKSHSKKVTAELYKMHTPPEAFFYRLLLL